MYPESVINQLFSFFRPKLDYSFVGVVITLGCSHFVTGLTLEVFGDENLKASGNLFS